jgi:hypothetical protein
MVESYVVVALSPHHATRLTPRLVAPGVCRDHFNSFFTSSTVAFSIHLAPVNFHICFLQQQVPQVESYV